MITMIIAVQPKYDAWSPNTFLKEVDEDELKSELAMVFDKWVEDAVLRSGGRLVHVRDAFEFTISKHGV